MKKYITSERPNLFEPNVYISMLVKIEGKVTENTAAEAVRKAYAANESTMSEIVISENGEAYFEKRGESGCKIFFDGRSPKAIINESEKRAFDIKDGELVRTYIIGEKDGITLLIHAHHLVGDGKSVLILIGDILDSLDGKTLDFKPLLPINGEYLEKRAKLSFGARLFLENVNRRWARKGSVFGWEDYYAVHKKYWSAHSTDFEIFTYGVEELKKRCAGKATLNSLLIAEILRRNPGKKAVGIPVSIREGDKGMSNQTSGIAFKFGYREDKSFERNLRGLHKIIYKRLKDNRVKYFVLLFLAELSPTLMDSVLLYKHGCFSDPLSERMADIMKYNDKKIRDIGVTNLGRIGIRGDYEGFKLKNVVFIPPKVSYSREVIGVSTYGDKLTVCRIK